MPRRKQIRKTGRKQKTRDLWLEIKYKVPGLNDAATRRFVVNKLIDSIRDGSYTYPQSWKVAIFWKNSRFAPLRHGEFTQEMRDSAISSVGWDKAVITYLEGIL